MARRRHGNTRNRTGPRWRIARRKRIVEHLIDVRRVLRSTRDRLRPVRRAVGPPLALCWRPRVVAGVDRHAASRSSESTHLATSSGIGDADAPRSAFLTSSVTMITSDAAAAAYPTSSTLPVTSARAAMSANATATIRLLTFPPVDRVIRKDRSAVEKLTKPSIYCDVPVELWISTPTDARARHFKM